MSSFPGILKAEHETLQDVEDLFLCWSLFVCLCLLLSASTPLEKIRVILGKHFYA